MLNKTQPQRGSVLLEALVGLLIFATALVAVISLVTSSLIFFTDARRSFAAARAAREGMEMAVAKHQNHVLCVTSGSCPISDWQDNLLGDFEVDATETNRLEPNQRFRDFDATKTLCTAVNPPKHQDKFTRCSGSHVPLQGNVTRKVTMEQLDSERVKLLVDVSWDRRRGGRASLVLEGVLFGPL
jgi:hypothetical protein